MSKYEYVSGLYEYAVRGITENENEWKGYLKTASGLYRYPFRDQVMIYAQRADASAVASMEVWNKKCSAG